MFEIESCGVAGLLLNKLKENQERVLTARGAGLRTGAGEEGSVQEVSEKIILKTGRC